jgi:hypothetical protein
LASCYEAILKNITEPKVMAFS